MYSPGMVGFGHVRRNASIAQALRRSPSHGWVRVSVVTTALAASFDEGSASTTACAHLRARSNMRDAPNGGPSFTSSATARWIHPNDT
jgi:hypothetical protein